MHSQEDTEPITVAHGSQTADPNETNHLINGFRLVIVMGSFMLMMAISGLDMTIVATALVTITSHFNAVPDIAWLTSVIFIMQTGLLLFYGKLLNVMPPRTVLLVAAVIFVLGSLFCAVTPSINFLIFGRAVSGVGAAGLWVSVLAITGRISTMSQRPILIGALASAFGLCSIIGPVLGGVLSERVSWRWCFYINLPIGVLGIVLGILFIPNLPSLTVHKKSAWDTWLGLDWIGTGLNFIGVFLFLLGLQWGGNTKPWSDAGVIITMVLGIAIMSLFFAWEIRKGLDAILPTSMLKRRNILGNFFLSGFLHLILVASTFYLPILYQLRGHSVIRSGVDILPLVLAGIVGGAMSGISVGITGHVWVWLFFPPLLSSLAFGFLASSNIDTSLARLVGYQILIGFALGATTQNCFLMAQAEYADQEDMVPQATSLVAFAGIGFSAIGLAASGAIFSSVLHSQVQKLNLDLSDSLRTLVLENVDVVMGLPEDLRTPLIQAYTTAVNRVFISEIAIAAAAGLSALIVERKKISLKLSGGSKGSKGRSARRSSTYYDEIFTAYKAEPYIPLL